ncbi:MAG TPA: TMEM175 family protein [Puia sp.]|nr:TMEM175 family protein [Puia sp.]
MKDFIKKEVAFERVIFFSDAIVAIAITLLALNLKLEIPPDHSVSFSDLLLPWRNYLAFILSFINIAGFWRTHHNAFVYIYKMDDRMMFLNVCWLFLIITLPFATTLVSTHFAQTPVIFLYSMNIFGLSIIQNSIWDYADARNYVDKEKLPEIARRRFRLTFNLDMINSLVCVILSFFFPTLSFIFLFFKLPMYLFATFYLAGKRKKDFMPLSKTDRDKPAKP